MPPVHKKGAFSPTTTQNSQSRLGPNSQGDLPASHEQMPEREVAEVRVAAEPPRPRESVGPPIDEAGGQRNKSERQFYTRVQKRSFKRACRRALAAGFTQYRGQTLRASQVLRAHAPIPFVNKPPAPQAQTRIRGGKSNRRLQYLSHNVGGLSAATLQELQVFLQSKPELHVLLLQETHYTSFSEWESRGRRFISSGTKDKSDGVLVALSAAIPRERIRSAEIVPGRVLRVRFEFYGQQVDVLCVYQFTRRQTWTDEVYLKHRKQVWDAIAQTARQVPQRSLFLVCGDMNANCSQSPGKVGPNLLHTAAHYGRKAADGEGMDSMLRATELCVLNSWGGDRRSPSAITWAPHS